MPRRASISACGGVGVRVVAGDGHPAAAQVARLVSPRLCEVIEPATNSGPTVSPWTCRPHVAGDERVDVARDEDDVVDPLVLDVREQLLALTLIALPGVERVVGVAEDLEPASSSPRCRRPPGGLGGGGLLLGPVHLLAAQQVARVLPSSAQPGVTASSHGWSSRYWRWSSMIRSIVLPNFDRTEDPVVPAGVRRHRLEPRLVAGRRGAARCSARRPAGRRPGSPPA